MMGLSRGRHMIIQDLVIGIKTMINDGNLGRLSLALLIVSENFANDKYVLNLFLRKTNGLDDKGVKEQRDYIKHLLSYL